MSWGDDDPAAPTAPAAEWGANDPAHAPPSWGHVAGQALLNLPASTFNDIIKPVAKGVYHLGAHVVSDPVGSAGAVGNAAVSAAKFIGSRSERRRVAMDTAEKVAPELGQYTAGYFNEAPLKERIANHPAQVMMDLATVLSGGEAAGIRGAGRLASFVDPVSLGGKALTRAVDLSAGPASQVIGMISGAGPENILNRYQAGRIGGEPAQVARDNARRNVPVEDVVDQARTAIDNMRQNRSNAYNAGIGDTLADTRRLDMTPILQHVDDIERGLYSPAGMPKVSDTALNVARQVREEVAGHAGPTLGPDGSLVGHNAQPAVELDALKRRLQGIAGEHVMNREASRIPTDVANRVRQTIIDQVPSYERTMGAYSTASDTIDQIARTLSLGNRATTDTAVRKLQSALRQDASTGTRRALLEELTQAGAPNLPYALAGQATSSWMPHGLARLNTTHALTAHLLTPAALALPLTSPRIAGGMSQMLGAGVRNAERFGPAARRANELAYQLERNDAP